MDCRQSDKSWWGQCPWRRWVGRILLVCAGLSVATSVLAGAQSLAEHGILDLSGVDLTHGQMVELRGNWQLYWGQLLTPDDFRDGKSPAGGSEMRVPLHWRHATWRGGALPQQGHGTYRLLIDPPRGTTELSLRFEDISSAYAMWVNGRQLAQSGRVGTDRVSEKAGVAIIAHTVRFGNLGGPVEILIQVSNYHGNSGGIGTALKLAAPRTLDTFQMERWGLALGVVGGLLVMCIYHFALFLARRNSLAPLFLSLYCLLRTANGVFSGASDWAVFLFAPEMDEELAYVVGMTCLAVSFSFLQAFFNCLYPKEFPRWMLLVVTALGVVIAVTGVTTRFSGAIGLNGFYVYILSVLVYSVVSLLRAWRSGRAGAKLLLTGYALLGLTGINDILVANDLIQSAWLAPVGTLAFVLCQSFVLARRYASALFSVEALSERLERQNVALQDEMAERTRLEREVEIVSEDERRAISRALHDGLCQELTAARLRCSLLQRASTNGEIPEADIRSLSSILEGAVNHAYELSRGLWPIENDARNLVGSIEQLASNVRSVHRLDIDVRCDTACEACSNHHAAQIFHVAKEALQNVVKHAKARNVNIALECGRGAQKLVFRVRDDGVGPHGHAPSHGGLGTRIMAHRARMIGGEFAIQAAPGGGDGGASERALYET